jgi:hypothetical protein
MEGEEEEDDDTVEEQLLLTLTVELYFDGSTPRGDVRTKSFDLRSVKRFM